MQDCYISSTSTTHKDRAHEIIGPCGPCSWINLLELKGSFELEKELAEIGRLKPFYASTFISFLLWAQKYGVDVDVYTSSFEISEGTFNNMFSFEGISEEKQTSMKEEANNLVKNVVSHYRNKLHILKDKPIDLIDNLLNNGFRVAFNVACKFPPQEDFVGHMRVCVRKENGRYIILDSYLGKLNYTREEMIRDITNLEKISGTYHIAAYKN